MTSEGGDTVGEAGAGAAPGGREDRRAPVQLSLAARHDSLGASWTVDRGVRLPAHYGDPTGELRALTEGCALWDASGCDRLELVGSDRRRFLGGMVTAEVAGLETGQSRYGLFTDVKGRILADVTILAHEDGLWLRLPAATGESIQEHLSKFIITDDVEIRRLDGVVPIIVAGPQAADLLVDRLGDGEPPGAGEHRPAELHAAKVHLVREERLGVPAYSLWVAEPEAGELVEALLAAPEPPRPVGLEAIESRRIEAGIPRFGFDMGRDTFPQEAGVDDAVSYEKGCYLGQEVVARIHYRGGVQRYLVRLELAPEVTPSVGEAISFEGRESGRLTSVAPLPGSDGRTALAIVAKRAAEPGSVVELESGGTATVCAPAGIGT